jgi:hypothetical protein
MLNVTRAVLFPSLPATKNGPHSVQIRREYHRNLTGGLLVLIFFIILSEPLNSAGRVYLYFCFAGKKGWNFEQISIRISDFVEPTPRTFPHAHLFPSRNNPDEYLFSLSFQLPMYLVTRSWILKILYYLSFLPFFQVKNSRLSIGFSEERSFLRSRRD